MASVRIFDVLHPFSQQSVSLIIKGLARVTLRKQNRRHCVLEEVVVCIGIEVSYIGGKSCKSHKRGHGIELT